MRSEMKEEKKASERSQDRRSDSQRKKKGKETKNKDDVQMADENTNVSAEKPTFTNSHLYQGYGTKPK